MVRKAGEETLKLAEVLRKNLEGNRDDPNFDKRKLKEMADYARWAAEETAKKDSPPPKMKSTPKKK